MIPKDDFMRYKMTPHEEVAYETIERDILNECTDPPTSLETQAPESNSTSFV